MWRAATFKPPLLWRKGGLWGGRGVLPVGKHKGGGAGAVAGPEKDSMSVPDRDNAHYGCQDTVVGTCAEAAQEGA